MLDAGGWAEISTDRPLLRSRLFLAGMHDLGLQVANVTARDLALGPRDLRAMADSVGVQLVSANILRDGRPWLPPYWLMRRRIGEREIGIGITGITEPMPSVTEALPDSEHLEIVDPMQAARAVLAILEQQSDVQVLLTNLPASDLWSLSSQLPDYDLLISGAGDLKEASKPGAAPLVLSPGSKCKYLGWTAVRLANGPTVVQTADGVVQLDSKIRDNPQMAKRVQEFKELLKEAGPHPVAAVGEPLGGPASPAPSAPQPNQNTR